MVKLISIISVFIFLSAGMAAADTGRDRKESTAQEKQVQAIKASYAKLPLSFIKNEGQKDKAILYYEQGSGHATAFTKEGVSLSLAGSELVTLTPLNPSSFTIEALDKREGKVNYFSGKDPSKWKTHIATYGAILYRGIYKGIDMKFYGTNSRIEYDIIVAPGADPKKVRLSYKGAEKLTVTSEGELEITLAKGSVFQKKPFVYQMIGETKKEIAGKFVLLDKSTYGFEVGDYDKNVPLTIDPTLVYSTYLGGTYDDEVYAIAFDSSGNMFVAGGTHPTPVPWGGDVFIFKFGPSGNTLLYSTYLRGDSRDSVSALAVDSSGSAYLAGRTSSTDFPTANAYQGSKAGTTDAFIAKLGPSGDTLVYSTYLGGTGDNSAHAIAINSSGNAYVAGRTNSTAFPTTADAYQGSNAGGYDGFIAKLGASGNTLVYSTYLGGTGSDTTLGIALDSSENVYVAGHTPSTDFPTLNPYQGSNAGRQDGFIAKLGPSGDVLVYSTYLGGTSDDYIVGIALDSSGNVYVAGYTLSADLPTVNAYQGSSAGYSDGFITKLGPSGNTVAYSTYLGGTGNDSVYGIALDSSENAYVAGATTSTNFPVLNAYQWSKAGGHDAFLTKLGPSGNTLVYSTYLGGTGDDSAYAIAVSSLGNVCVAGYTFSTDFPTVNAYQGSKPGIVGCSDAFIAMFGGGLAVYPYFSGDGFYKYESAWDLLTTSQPQIMVAGGSIVYASFPGDGLYKHDGSWTLLTTAQPARMVAAGSIMHAYFTGSGLYRYNGSWTRIAATQPETMTAGGSSVYVYNSGDGLYRYDGSSWTLLTRTQPQNIVGSGDGIYASFASDGLYKYNGTWTRITTGQPSGMTVSGTTLYPYFPGDGLYKYDGSWTLLTRTEPAYIAASGDGFYATFASAGLYKYNGSWTKITTVLPSNMVVSGTTLYPYFSGDGLYKYDGSWTFLTPTQPQSMVGMGAN